MGDNKKIGIDIHGVINDSPEIFSPLTKKLKELGYEIHILTGPRLEKPYRTKMGNFDSVREELDNYDITYDFLFSVLDYNLENNKNVWENERGWWTDEKSWNCTKGKYCSDNNISLHIDDTKAYGEYFKTPFAHLTPSDNPTRTLELFNVPKDNEVVELIKNISNNDILITHM